ncbi:MAG: hypothetical protein AAF918_13865 [Pseudomonadota bacterium]
MTRGARRPVTTATAPGKLVLAGEYAVLAGAPGVGLALDASAGCTFEVDPTTRRWTIETLGFASDPVTTFLPAIIIEAPPPPSSPLFLLWYALNSIKGLINELPAGGRLTLDSRAFQRDGEKLGIGSSAAVCTALTGLLETLAGDRPRLETAMVAHRTAQGGKGSGLDVATAFHGGLTSLQQTTTGPVVERISDVPSFGYRVIATPQAADSVRFIHRFSDWLATNPANREFVQLCNTAERVRSELSFDALTCYADALHAFDRVSKLGIYTAMHHELHTLAARHGVAYKPCGAGGGDIGLLFGRTDADLDACVAALNDPALSGPRPTVTALRQSDHGLRLQH